MHPCCEPFMDTLLLMMISLYTYFQKITSLVSMDDNPNELDSYYDWVQNIMFLNVF